MIAWKSGALVIFLIAVIFAFQNCGKAGFENVDLGSVSTSSVDAQLAKIVEFPYDVSVNQIAYMSCPFPGAPAAIEGAGEFTWKVGAFDNNALSPALQPAGLRVRAEFLSQFNGLPFNSSIKPTKFKEALMTLPSLAGSQLQLSIRSYNSLRTTLALFPNGGKFPPESFMAGISTDAIAGAFDYNNSAITTNPVNYFQQAVSVADGSFEGSLSFSGTSFLQSTFVTDYLVLGFSQPQSANGEAIAGPTGVLYQAYAKGFSPTFGDSVYSADHPPTYDGNQILPPQILTDLTEKDLLSGVVATQPSWHCDKRFKIVRLAERTKNIYIADNFELFGGACPGGPSATVIGEYCPLPATYQVSGTLLFGRSRLEFANGVCPFNRYRPDLGASDSTHHALTGTYCAERYTQACPSEPYASLTPENTTTYYALRRFLPEDKWDINMSRGCIVKIDSGGSNCYGPATAKPVVYDESFFPYGTGQLDADSSLEMYQSCDSGGYCPAYLTLCLKY